MYRATLKEGKTYHVGGVTFIKGTPRVVSDELGEYLKTVAAFEVEELLHHEKALEGLQAADFIQALEEKQEVSVPVAEEAIGDGEGSKGLQRGKEHNHGRTEGSPSQHRGRSRKHKGGAK